MESLKDLGPDSPYVRHHRAGRPAIRGPCSAGRLQAAGRLEVHPGDRLCAGLGDRRLGCPRQGHGPPMTRRSRPAESTPLLDNAGDPVAGGKTIAGATTVKLTTAQANLATWQWGCGCRRHPGRPGPGQHLRHTREPDLWLRDGALRRRCAQRRQPRVHPHPDGGRPRLLLRVLRDAATDQRHDHDRQEGSRAPAGTKPSFHFSGPLSFDPAGFTLANLESETFIPRWRTGVEGCGDAERRLQAGLGELQGDRSGRWRGLEHALRVGPGSSRSIWSPRST